MSRRLAEDVIPEVSEHGDVSSGCELSGLPSGREIIGAGMSSSDTELDAAAQTRLTDSGTPCQDHSLRRHKSLTNASKQDSKRGSNSKYSDGSDTGLTRSLSTPLDVPSRAKGNPSGGVPSPAPRWNPFQIMCNIPNPEALRCKRLYIRRGALCDPEKMPMPQETRERVQRDVEHRKHSWRRKFTVYIRLKLGTDGEVDLF